MKTFLRMALPLALLLAAPLQAQTTLGVKGGINIAQTDFEDLDFGSRTGFLGGAFVRFGLGSTLAVQPELLFVPKGASESDSGVELTFKLDYIEIPILLQYRFQTEGALTPVLFAGPYVAIETTCDLAGSAGGGSQSVACNALDEVTEGFLGDLNTKSTDIGAIFGGGLDFYVGSVIVGAEARYGLGLTNVNDTPNSTQSIKNRGWSVLGSVGFPLM
jgi:hypothetical protein